MEDSLAWDFEKSGNYTVKTAYRALMTQNERLAREEGTATGTSGNDQQLWKALWKLNVIPKVRVFWWRVLRGILPDESTLKHHCGHRSMQSLFGHERGLEACIDTLYACSSLLG